MSMWDDNGRWTYSSNPDIEKKMWQNSFEKSVGDITRPVTPPTKEAMEEFKQWRVRFWNERKASRVGNKSK